MSKYNVFRNVQPIDRFLSSNNQLRDSISTKMVRPGKRESHHPGKYCLPSFNRLPQLTSSNFNPRPTKDKEASSKMAVLKENKAVTNKGPLILGQM